MSLYTDAEVQAFNEWLGIGPNAAKNVLDKIAPTIAARALRKVGIECGSITDVGLYRIADEIEAGQP